MMVDASAIVELLLRTDLVLRVQQRLLTATRPACAAYVARAEALGATLVTCDAVLAASRRPMRQ